MNWIAVILLIAFAIISAMSIYFGIRGNQLARPGRIGGGRDTKMPKKAQVAHQSNFDLMRSIVNYPKMNDILNGVKTLKYLSEIEDTMPYFASRGLVKTTLHNGQLKLFLTELEFLTEVLPTRDTPAFVIYAGSSPSHKLSFLADLFPGVCFICVDPNEHLVMFDRSDQYDQQHIDKFHYFVAAGGNRFVEKRPRVINLGGQHITRGDAMLGAIPADLVDIIAARRHTYYMIEDYMTDELSAQLAPLCQRGDVYFISDIRSRDESYGEPSELDILWNSAMMYNWLKALRPRKFMLKFHTPYTITDRGIETINEDYKKNTYTHAALAKCTDIDFLADYRAKRFKYIAPERIYIQAFAGQSSTESRLVASSLNIEEYDVADYENKFCYYNRVRRAFGWHTEHADYVDPELGIDRCGDCALMCRIFEDYWNKYGQVDKAVIKAQIIKLLAVIKRTLRSRGVLHGVYVNQIHNRDELIGVLEILNAHIVVEENFNPKDMRPHKWSAKDCGRWLAVFNYLKDNYGKKEGQRLFNACKIIDIYGYGILAEESIKSRATIMFDRYKAHQMWIDIKKILGSNAAPEPNLLPVDIYEMEENAGDICGENWLRLISNVLECQQVERIILITSSTKYIVKLPSFDGLIIRYTVCDTDKNVFLERFSETDLVISRVPSTGQLFRTIMLHFCKKYVNTTCIVISTARWSSVDLFYTPLSDATYIMDDVNDEKEKKHKISIIGPNACSIEKGLTWSAKQ